MARIVDGKVAAEDVIGRVKTLTAELAARAKVKPREPKLCPNLLLL